MNSLNLVLKEGANQILIANSIERFSTVDLNKWENDFLELKTNGRILQNNFSDFTWILLKDFRKLEGNSILTFQLSGFPEVNTAMKCFTIYLLKKGMTGQSVATRIKILQKTLVISECLSEAKIEDFEEFVYNQSEYTIRHIAMILPVFCSFYNFKYDIDDYSEVVDGLPYPDDKVRKIPNYKSILKFDEVIKSITLGEGDKHIKLKYYPLFLWWIITGVIPMRASEFLELEYNCCFIDKERYWIKIPRSKIKQTIANRIERVDTLEINEFTYTFIERYKCMLGSEFKSYFLLSWKAYNFFCPNSQCALTAKRNPEIMGLGSISLLFKDFYKQIIKDEKVIPLKPSDSRHIAFCNLMLQGHNPIAIARFGGHTRLHSQTHYYEHLDTYAESYVFAMAEKLQLSQLFKNNLEKRDIYRRARTLSTYLPSELEEFLKIEKGYCTVKPKGCEDFSGCEESCWDCGYHVPDFEKYKGAEIELQQRSDKLREVIHEQLQLLQSISRSIFVDYDTERCSFSDNSRLTSTAEQLGTTMAKKIIIDSKLLEFVMED